jgi:hypothetical protein
MSRMNDQLTNSTVAEFLSKNPEAVRFFQEYRTACVGCCLARFCTLKDVALTYQLDEEPFLERAARLSVPES